MGIPYRQALRLRRICELDEVFEERLGELRRYLLQSGFRTEVVDSQLQKARDVSRTALLDQGYNKKDKLENSVRPGSNVELHMNRTQCK